MLDSDGLVPHYRPVEPEGIGRLARALGGEYRVIRVLGQGGFAEVYEVVDTNLQRRLAVKVLRSDLPWSPGALSRFKQEARAIARLNHPNTVPIHFVGEAEGLVFYAMPYLEGRTLAELLREEGPMPSPRVLAIAEPILEALQHAHEHGLVHRDVKPANILIESATGRPLLVDFGIVKYLDGPSHLTESGFIVGTPLYMSPEQAMGQHDVDARADIYGVGAVLFQLLTGAPPFEGSDSREIVRRHLTEPVPVATLSRDGIPTWLSAIVVRCMAKHPGDRYPSARALQEALRTGRGAMAPPAGGMPPAWQEAPTRSLPLVRRPVRWSRWLAGTAVLLLALAALLIRPKASLIVQNRLTEAIALSWGDTGLTIPPGDSARIAVPPGRPLEAQWAMVRPATLDGRMLGDGVEGAILEASARGELRWVVDAASDGEPRFTPMVVNGTSRPISIAVLSRDDSVSCGCSVRPGDSLRLGYYLLGDESAVSVSHPEGGVVRFDLTEQSLDSVTGAVTIRVDSASLRSERPDPLRASLPVR
ncbi:MAG: serine/threonine protein kinase [Gemmatimonadales bacterium]|nr:serine/threonine protein kinase [Gemmatimonadales bacterium]